MDKTLEFFKIINTIPRPSGHEEKMQKFLIDFAKNRNLEYSTDNTLNVVIKKKSNIKNCVKTLILQAHQDMVCEKNENVNINFLTDAITTEINGDFLMAKGTTLGADNGVGLSMILSILDDDSLKIPNLECIFTTQEETTMLGALNLDVSNLKSKHILSIDGTDEGKIEVSSAGMVVANIEKNFDKKTCQFDKSKTILKINLTGLHGGHSGTEINTPNKNAIKLMFEFLQNIGTNLDFVKMIGGGKSNAIPRECGCVCVAQNFDKNTIKKLVCCFEEKYKAVEKDIKINVEEAPFINQIETIGENNSKTIIDFVNNFENGVLVYDQNIKDFPIVSNNLANINLENGKLKIVVSLRSSVTKLEKKYLEIIENKCKKVNFSFKIESSAPFFEKKLDSYLQKVCCDSYKILFDKEAEIHGVHAGLEGGVFAKKIKGVDICVIAPNIYDCHSPHERVSISSVGRVYKWLEKIVENF